MTTTIYKSGSLELCAPYNDIPVSQAVWYISITGSMIYWYFEQYDIPVSQPYEIPVSRALWYNGITGSMIYRYFGQYDIPVSWAVWYTGITGSMIYRYHGQYDIRCSVLIVMTRFGNMNNCSFLEVTRLLLFAAQSSHDLVPPEVNTIFISTLSLYRALQLKG